MVAEATRGFPRALAAVGELVPRHGPGRGGAGPSGINLDLEDLLRGGGAGGFGDSISARACLAVLALHERGPTFRPRWS